MEHARGNEASKLSAVIADARFTAPNAWIGISEPLAAYGSDAPNAIATTERMKRTSATRATAKHAVYFTVRAKKIFKRYQ